MRVFLKCLLLVWQLYLIFWHIGLVWQVQSCVRSYCVSFFLIKSYRSFSLILSKPKWGYALLYYMIWSPNWILRFSVESFCEHLAWTGLSGALIFCLSLMQVLTPGKFFWRWKFIELIYNWSDVTVILYRSAWVLSPFNEFFPILTLLKVKYLRESFRQHYSPW